MNRFGWMAAAVVVVVALGVAGCSKKVDTLRQDQADVTGVKKDSGMMTEDLKEETMAPQVAEVPEMPPAPSKPAMSDSASLAAALAARLGDVHFDFDKSVIRDVDKPILLENADLLKGSADLRVVVEGHCDERGTTAYNLALGERRANATRRYLIALGVSPAQLSTVSYGEERPLCTVSDESCWSRNRRAHLTVATD
jgi:peptidoglycan-associated lipoprotein